MRTRWALVALVALSAALVLGLFAGRLADVGRPYPGFFTSIDLRVFVVDPDARAAGLDDGDRIVAVDGASPLKLERRSRASPAPIRYEVERAGRRFDVTLAPRTFTAAILARHFGGYFVVSALMLLVGVLVYAQNPSAAPNRNFLVYMCLWAVSNVAVPDALLGFDKPGATLIGLVSTLLSVHGWVFFLTYPVNATREAWLRRAGVIRALYATGLVLGVLTTVTFVALRALAPAALATGWAYPAANVVLLALALVSFPVKIVALLDTRRRAASPLVNQQTTVLLLGIGLGLGLWLALMLMPLVHLYRPPVDPQIGSACVLLYPLAIAYATVRYRLFDATVVIRRSVVYTALAALVAGGYALALAVANALLAHADLARSPWFAAAVMFVVALAFYPVREWLQRTVDRTFFRERYDYAAAIQALARSMTGLLDLEEITRRVTSTIEAVMHARAPRLVVGAPPAALAGALAAAPGALSRYQIAADPTFSATAPAALDAYRALDAEVVVPLRFQEEVRGLLVLGPKRAEAPYTAEDLALLETLADQTAVAVANAGAHQQVVEYARQLERSLLIRTNLAKFVPRRVRDLIEASPEAPSLDKRETDVTVLFADITGYTRLSTRLAGQDLDALVERYFGAFFDEIVKHGGDVNETAGDGLMVIFHEGAHAAAAVETARAIHRRAAELNAGLADRFEPLAMHIGVNTGPALLGATKIEGHAGTRWTYTASGLTTNIAARLAAVAEGGEIVISESTRARLDPAPIADDLGMLALKNVDRPLRAFRLR
ncbi:MAG TPA: adenylate/guanylate cyclase domain-containing protein [Methylomirabilota bacterium]|nr:adenylate/guanylate cyclase domain-containing protein [Methylomirabilota bacterium]